MMVERWKRLAWVEPEGGFSSIHLPEVVPPFNVERQ
jgi:hypothetical protein